MNESIFNKIWNYTMHHNYDQHGEEENDSPTVPENDICCDGKASITKKPE